MLLKTPGRLFKINSLNTPFVAEDQMGNDRTEKKLASADNGLLATAAASYSHPCLRPLRRKPLGPLCLAAPRCPPLRIARGETVGGILGAA